MKKKIIMGLFVLATVIGIAIAENKICKIFDNRSNGGITVVVNSKEDPNDKNITIQDYINTIKIMSNGNKMRITDCRITRGKGSKIYDAIGKIIEGYGEVTVEYKSYKKGLSSDEIIVTAEGCN